MSQSPLISGAATQRRLIVVGVGGGLIFLALVCVALGITLFTRSRSPSVAGYATPAPTQGPSAPVLLAGSTGSVPLTLTAPSEIEIKSRQFQVIPSRSPRVPGPTSAVPFGTTRPSGSLAR